MTAPFPYPAEGDRFGRWTAVSIVGGKWRKVMCRCDCGRLRAVANLALHSGRSQSCSNCPRHGGHETPEYHSWEAARARCFNRKNTNYHLYGGRGITMCERWSSFADFLADVGARPSPKHTLDRIDPDGNYEPGNVRWATRAEQAQNMRGSLTACAVLLMRYMRRRRTPLKALARAFGVAPSTVSGIVHYVNWREPSFRVGCGVLGSDRERSRR